MSARPPDDPLLLTVTEVAARCRVHERTVRRWLELYRIRHRRNPSGRLRIFWPIEIGTARPAAHRDGNPVESPPARQRARAIGPSETSRMLAS